MKVYNQCKDKQVKKSVLYR